MDGLDRGRKNLCHSLTHSVEDRRGDTVVFVVGVVLYWLWLYWLLVLVVGMVVLLVLFGIGCIGRWYGSLMRVFVGWTDRTLVTAQPAGTATHSRHGRTGHWEPELPLTLAVERTLGGTWFR